MIYINSLFMNCKFRRLKSMTENIKFILIIYMDLNKLHIVVFNMPCLHVSNALRPPRTSPKPNYSQQHLLTNRSLKKCRDLRQTQCLSWSAWKHLPSSDRGWGHRWCGQHFWHRAEPRLVSVCTALWCLPGRRSDLWSLRMAANRRQMYIALLHWGGSIFLVTCFAA